MQQSASRSHGPAQPSSARIPEVCRKQLGAQGSRARSDIIFPKIVKRWVPAEAAAALSRSRAHYNFVFMTCYGALGPSRSGGCVQQVTGQTKSGQLFFAVYYVPAAAFVPEASHCPMASNGLCFPGTVCLSHGGPHGVLARSSEGRIPAAACFRATSHVACSAMAIRATCSSSTHAHLPSAQRPNTHKDEGKLTMTNSRACPAFTHPSGTQPQETTCPMSTHPSRGHLPKHHPSRSRPSCTHPSCIHQHRSSALAHHVGTHPTRKHLSCT